MLIGVLLVERPFVSLTKSRKPALNVVFFERSGLFTIVCINIPGFEGCR